MYVRAICILAVCLASLVGREAMGEADKRVGPEFIPTADFEIKDVQGWKVYVQKILLSEQRQLGSEVLQEIAMQLYRINRLLPEEPLRKMREIPIWIHVVKIGSDARSPLAEYHWSADWLRGAGRNPDMARAIEIGDMKNFLRQTKHKPFLMLHELAHGYHERNLTAEEDEELEAIYGRAMKKGLYQKVLHFNGDRRRAYAASLYKEYFAEIVVSFYGTCRNYPFVRGELKEYDPDAHAFVEKVLHKR